MNYRIVKPTDDELRSYGHKFMRHSTEKICILCGSEFTHGNQNVKICGCCKLEIECPVCGKYFEWVLENHSGSAQKKIVDSILDKKDLNVFCSKSCSNISRKGFGHCEHCGADNVRIYNGRCEMCANRELNAPIECPVHGHQERSFGGICILCHNQTEEMREQARQLGVSHGSENIKRAREILMKRFQTTGAWTCGRHDGVVKKHCDACGEETNHFGNRCLKCRPYHHDEYCEHCRQETPHFGSSCLVCNPMHHKKYCKKCEKVTNHLHHRCLECQPMFEIKHCETCDADTKHFGSRCLECNPVQWNNERNGIRKRHCEKCECETFHLGSRCLMCKPVKGLWDSFIMKHCDQCGLETPHKYGPDAQLYCMSCSGERVWCEHCQKWETLVRNGVKEHWIFYRSKTRQWMSENRELVERLEQSILGIYTLLDRKPVAGVYCWYLDGVPFYVGESVDILSRAYDHMMELVESPEYWNFALEMGMEVELRVLQEVRPDAGGSVDMHMLHELELQWVNALKPISQKCDGTDSILPLDERMSIA